MSKEAMKLALEALESLSMNDYSGYEISKHETYKIDNAITVLTEAMAEQPAQKRPQNCGTGYCSCIECVMEPAQRTWVGLTDEEVWDLWNSYTEEPFPEWFVDFKRAYKVLEAKLKEKNT